MYVPKLVKNIGGLRLESGVLEAYQLRLGLGQRCDRPRILYRALYQLISKISRYFREITLQVLDYFLAALCTPRPFYIYRVLRVGQKRNHSTFCEYLKKLQKIIVMVAQPTASKHGRVNSLTVKAQIHTTDAEAIQLHSWVASAVLLNSRLVHDGFGRKNEIKLNTLRIYPVELAAELKLGHDCRRLSIYAPPDATQLDSRDPVSILQPTRLDKFSTSSVLFQFLDQNPS